MTSKFEEQGNYLSYGKKANLKFHFKSSIRRQMPKHKKINAFY